MRDQLTQKLLTHPKPYINEAELAFLLGGTPDSRYGKIKRLSAAGKLLHIRRGLYILTEVLGYLEKPHPFELAHHIYAPSYISLESALSYHQLIPEAVYVMTSVSTRRVKEFKTPLGEFTYATLPTPNFYIGVERVSDSNVQFMIASPWKAVFDYIFCYKKEYENIQALFKSLRISPKDLPILSSEAMEEFEDYYRSSRITCLIKKIKRNHH